MSARSGDIGASDPDREADADHGAGPVIFLMGPTAAGKTGIAAALAERGPFEIVSVDSALVFRHLDLGTGKPAREVLARAPHRLIDIRDPDERYSAAEFRDDAMGAIADIRASGRVPLLTGGTGLYFRALEKGLAVLPPANPAVRAGIEREAARAGVAGRCTRGLLASIRRRRAVSIRTIRNASSGRWRCRRSPAGRCRRCSPAGAAADSPGRCCRIVIEPADRETLHRDVAARFSADARRRPGRRGRRVETTLASDGTERPRLRLVGYRQVWAHLAGRCTREEMTAQAIAATRQLARRQLTWLRSDRTAVRVDCHAPDAAARVAAYAESFVGCAGSPA